MSTKKQTKENSTNDVSHAMWGGRFESGPDALMQRINSSIEIDKRMYRQDIAGSKAHAEMLHHQGILDGVDHDAIQSGLDQVLQEIEEGSFEFKVELEDIHMNIESRLADLIGDAAGRLHTARSRNDQVATDFRMWMRDSIAAIVDKLGAYQDILSKLKNQHQETAMPGFTHLQVAQPITLAQHLDAYLQMSMRDSSRFQDCMKRLNECPLGAAALAGTSFPIDRKMTAKNLDFDRPMENTLDCVSARDFANEFLFCCAQTCLHLSRLAEEVIIWSTPQFGFLVLSDEWSTGSSIMPQKKNPDAAELIRGKSGRATGNLVQLMMVMKALPLAYNKDMQEDKEPVFDSFDTVCLCIDAMAGMLETANWQIDSMAGAAEQGYSTATELANWLVREQKIPFRKAHEITGKIVKSAEEKDCFLSALPLEEMQAVEPSIHEGIYSVLSLEKTGKKAGKKA